MELKLYGPLHVKLEDETDADAPAVFIKNMESAERTACIEKILPVIHQAEDKNAFAICGEDWAENVSEYIVSVTRAVEQIRDRLYGVITCRSEQELTPLEILRLKRQSRDHIAEGWGEGITHFSDKISGREMSVHFWQDNFNPLLNKTELDARTAPLWEVREVDKDTFWTLIREAKNRYGQDMDASLQWLNGQLLQMGPQQAQNFHQIIHGYSDLAYKYGLWTAANIMLEGCSDDGFMDFRSWLIAQGREVYMAALRDPDSLADVQVYGEGSFELLAYVGDYAYSELTGRSAYRDIDRSAYEKLTAELKRDIEYGDGVDYPYKWSEAAVHLPKLCARYVPPERLALNILNWDDSWNTSSPEVRRAKKNAPKARRKTGRKKDASR